tara:strand:+ start:247 stop:420 length:174 start_codon:yes stop_codon:yes gene_type:complete
VLLSNKRASIYFGKDRPMIKKTRAAFAVPFIMLSALFKIVALMILPAEYREEGKEAI